MKEYIPTFDGFLAYQDTQFDKWNLMEMAKLNTGITGLNLVIWVDDDELYLDGGHSYRIKFPANYNDTNSREFASMTICDNPKIILHNQHQKITINDYDIKDLKKWIIKHQEKLKILADKGKIYDKNRRLIKKIEFTREDFEKYLGNEFAGYELLEQSISNLNVNIWLDKSRKYLSEYKIPIIKIQNNYSKKVDISNMIDMTIAFHPKILNNIKIKLKDKDLETVKNWIAKFKFMLERLSNKEISYSGFLKYYFTQIS